MFGALGSIAGGIVAQRSARDYAREQAEMADRARQLNNSFIGCYGGENELHGLSYSNAISPFATKATKPTAVRCQSCAAPMKHHTCEYCGTRHR